MVYIDRGFEPVNDKVPISAETTQLMQTFFGATAVERTVAMADPHDTIQDTSLTIYEEAGGVIREESTPTALDAFTATYPEADQPTSTQ